MVAIVTTLAAMGNGSEHRAVNTGPTPFSKPSNSPNESWPWATFSSSKCGRIKKLSRLANCNCCGRTTTGLRRLWPVSSCTFCPKTHPTDGTKNMERYRKLLTRFISTRSSFVCVLLQLNFWMDQLHLVKSPVQRWRWRQTLSLSSLSLVIIKYGSFLFLKNGNILSSLWEKGFKVNSTSSQAEV